MRVFISGGGEREAAWVASALAAGGFTVAVDAPCDLRVTLEEGSAQRLQAGDITLDLITRRAARDGRPIRLTGKEFAILAHMARSDRPIGRGDMLRIVWGYRHDPGTNLVAVHISRLRAKIGTGAITCDRDGYRLTSAIGNRQPDRPRTMPHA